MNKDGKSGRRGFIAVPTLSLESNGTRVNHQYSYIYIDYNASDGHVGSSRGDLYEKSPC